ncbi:MAG: hypothetical protein ACR2KO_00940 [Geodermatophilaceae bacterium]
MAEQDRSRWNADFIAEGPALITDALPRGATGPYQLHAVRGHPLQMAGDRVAAPLLTLKIILGIDNIVVISILAGKLPEHQRGPGADRRAVTRPDPADSHVVAVVDHRADGAPVRGVRAGDFRSRPHPYPGWRLRHRESDV